MKRNEVMEHIRKAAENPRSAVLARVILAFTAAALFVDVELFTVASTAVTAQKAAALVIYAAAVLLLRKTFWRIDSRILIYAALMAVAYSINYIVTGEFPARLATALVQVLLNAAAAIVLLSALSADERAFQFFLYALTASALVSAAVTLVQFFSQFSSAEDTARRLLSGSFARTAGLLKDPNYQAAALLWGIAALFSFRRLALIIPCFLIISAGILCTFSRMGILVLALLILVSPLLLHVPDRERRYRRWMLWLISAACAVLLVLIPGNWAGVLLRRFDSVIGIAKEIGPTGGASLLRDARVRLAYYSLQLFAQHPLTGVGVFNTDVHMAQIMGKPTAVHNTYLEFMLTGGIWGILVLVYLFFQAFGAVKQGCREIHHQRTRSSFIAILLLYIGISFFLSYHLDSTSWLVLVGAVYCRDLAKQGGEPADAHES
jgi:hypothetical protein